MTTIKLKGINKVKKTLANKTVAIFYYHRATGKRLRGDPSSAQFLDDYKEADRIAPRYDGTIAELIANYRASPKFKETGPTSRTRSRTRELRPLAPGTQREYKRMLTALEKEFGTMSITALGAKAAVGVFLTYQEEVGLDSPREADNRLTVLSAVLTYAYRKGKIARNPLSRFSRMYESDRSDILWLELDIAKFMDSAPVELQRALILAIHTGQRYGDLVRLLWSDYDGEYISLRQNKTRARVMVKVSAALKRMLDATPKTCPYILARANGRPWFTGKNDKEMGKVWRAHMDAAELRGETYLSTARNDRDLLGERLHFNDLRGTAVTLLAEAGCTVPEIASITGHTLESAERILEKYLSRTKAISAAAILKFENATATGFANRLQTKLAANS